MGPLKLPISVENKDSEKDIRFCSHDAQVDARKHLLDAQQRAKVEFLSKFQDEQKIH